MEKPIIQLERDEKGELYASIHKVLGLGKVSEYKEGTVCLAPYTEPMIGILKEAIITAVEEKRYSSLDEILENYARTWFCKIIDMEQIQLYTDKEGKLLGMKEESTILKENIVMIPLEITDEQIDDIVSTAFEGGINHWCIVADIATGEKNWEHWNGIGLSYASEIISKGGRILLEEIEDDHVDNEEKYTLTKEKVLDGIRLFTLKSHTVSNHIKLDLANYDANDADLIIQYGLFGELVFG